MGRPRKFTDEERKARHKEAERKWKENNPEKAKESSLKKSKKYYENHREERLAYATEVRKENPEYQKLWWENNRDKAREYRKKRRKQRAASNREWRRLHPAETLAHKHNRRAKELGAGGSFTAEEWFTLCFAVGFKCLCCGQIKKLTADHVIPLSKGGSNWLHNIQPLCGSCNSSKGTKSTDYRIPEEDRFEFTNNLSTTGNIGHIIINNNEPRPRFVQR